MPRRKVETISIKVEGHPTDIIIVYYDSSAKFRNTVKQLDIFAMRSSDLIFSSADSVVDLMLSVSSIWSLPLGDVGVFNIVKDKIPYFIFRNQG